MKLTKLIFLFVLSIAAISCSKDDDNPTPPYTLSSSNFVGTYNLNFFEEKVIETVTFANGTTSTSTSVNLGSIFTQTKYVFSADGSFTSSGNYVTTLTTVQADGTTVQNDPISLSLNNSGNYSLNVASGIVILNYTGGSNNGSTDIFAISNYTESSMSLLSEIEVTSGNSRTVTTKELKFTR
ncbi:hypothetical protein [Aequorivita sp. CIP111184]|uniref:hypothetical protein n=1 Tax=Aequorivita sp. CIP111184 TaxID=2211356 RepID=UPI000DBBFBFF|nr:hypothetical protein [Aequorivita sp. CIP111184]SRX52431.1 hypothetical protein AEQU1_00295 [Aequorivita sp. CIP111184]